MKKIALLILMSLSLLPTAAYAVVNTSTIDYFSVKTEFGGGDVTFVTKDKDAVCFGYWVSPSLPGFEQTVSTLLSAYHAKSSVVVTFTPSTADRWPASSNHYCKVLGVALGSI